MAALECKVAMVISRLVKFELLMEIKIEQKHDTSLVNRIPVIRYFTIRDINFTRIFY
jgi:hypothetical protein